MQLITDGKINTEAALSIIWKLLVAFVLWYFDSKLAEIETMQVQAQASKDRILVLEERTNQQRKELDSLNTRYQAMRDLLIQGKVVPRRRTE